MMSYDIRIQSSSYVCISNNFPEGAWPIALWRKLHNYASSTQAGHGYIVRMFRLLWNENYNATLKPEFMPLHQNYESILYLSKFF